MSYGRFCAIQRWIIVIAEMLLAVICLGGLVKWLLS